MADTSVTAVILAAGEGSRLEPLTNRRPKPMAPVANRPLLEYVVDAVAGAGIDHLALVVGYRQERIRNHFGDGDEWGVDIEYVEQNTQLGTGHAILQAESVVDDPFVVLNGDRIVEPSIVARVLENARETGSQSMAVSRVANPQAYGVVSLDGERVTEIAEKPTGPIDTDRINAGVYGFSSSIFDAIRATRTDGELTITSTLDRLARDGSVTAVAYDGRWLDVSDLWDLLTVNAAVIEDGQVAGNRDAGRDTDGSAVVADDVVLGENVHLGPQTTIGGSTAIGSNASIEASAVVENAVIFPDAVIGAGAVVRDAIVAGNARIGPNVSIVGEPSTVVVGDTVHEDVAFGGVVGDNATIGAGAALANGAIVGDDVRTDVGVTVRGRIEPGAIVRRG